MKKNKLCALLLVVLFLFGAAPAMANWELPGEIDGLTNDIVRLTPDSPAQKPAPGDFKNNDADKVRDVLEEVGTKVFVKTSVMNQIAGTSSSKQGIPLFKISVMSPDIKVDTDKSALVMYRLETSKFLGKKPGDLRVIKVYGDGEDDYKRYNPVYTGAAIANGKFAVVKGNTTTLVEADEEIQSGTYYIALCVKREDSFDIGKAGSFMIDPAFVYLPVEEVSVTGVTVSPKEKVIRPGGSATFSAVVAPENATNTNVTWSSSNNSLATVNSSGLVSIPSGATVGMTPVTITAASESDSNKKDTAIVRVGEPVTGVEVTPSATSIGVEQSTTLTALLAPSNALITTVTWTSSNPSIATVSSSGVVTGVAPGTATVTAITTDGEKTDSSTITVVSGPQPVTPGFQLPSGVENPIISIPGTVSESGLNPAAADTVEQTSSAFSSSSANYLVLKNSVVSNILSYRGNSMNSQIAIRMPVFKAVVSAAGKTGVVMFQLPSSSLVGHKAGMVVPVKAVSTSAPESRSYVFVDGASKLADGKFGIVKSDRTTFMGAEETFVSGYTYYIVFALKDGGVFDMNSAEMYITDPTFVGLSTGHRSSGGGCSTGAFAPAAIFLTLPLCVFFFSKRR